MELISIKMEPVKTFRKKLMNPDPKWALKEGKNVLECLLGSLHRCHRLTVDFLGSSNVHCHGIHSSIIVLV